VAEGARGHLAGGHGPGDASGQSEVVLTADRHELHLPTGANGDVIVDVRQHRADVVARLLAVGVSPHTLTTLLPEWAELIAAVAAEHATTS
jgi:hypothetical protein